MSPADAAVVLVQHSSEARDTPERQSARARDLARAGLARATGQPEEAWSFGKDEDGRPIVHGPAPVPEVSWSHTAGTVVAVVAPHGHVVGVDVEAQVGDRDPCRLAQRWFHPDETTAINALSNVERVAAFARAWVCKEAVAKATGRGLDDVLPGTCFVDAVRTGPRGQWREVADKAVADDGAVPRVWLLDSVPGAGVDVPVAVALLPGEDLGPPSLQPS